MAADEEESEDIFQGFAQLPIEPSETRKYCERCKRPVSVCLCAALPPERISVSTTVHILQHPREEFRLLATVPLLEACLPPEKCCIHSGRRFSAEQFPQLHKLVKQSNTLLLYPGTNAVDIRDIKSCVPGQSYNLIVLDGTWRQAKNIHSGNRFLQSARQVQMNHNMTSEYLIRTQPTNGSLCTVEAVALALSILERNQQIAEDLLRPLRALCQIQMDHGAVGHESTEERDKEFYQKNAQLSKKELKQLRQQRREKERRSRDKAVK